MSRNGRINERQKLRLFDLMSRNYVTLFGRFTSINGTHVKEDLWVKIKNDLNLMGPQKSVEQWKNCWRDLKKSARTKFMQIRQYKTKTGGGPPCPYVLTDHEQIIISICNLEALDGVDGQELGFKQTPPRDPVPALFRSRSASHSRIHDYTDSHASSRSRSPNGVDSHTSSLSTSRNGISMLDSRPHSPISREMEFHRSYQSKLSSDDSMGEVQQHSSKKYGVDSHRTGRSQPSDKPMPNDNRSADSDNALENEVDTHSRSSESTPDVIIVSSESDDSRKSFEKRKQALIATKESLNRECFGDLTIQNQSRYISLSSLRGQPWYLFQETLSKSGEALRASESLKDHSRHEPLSNYESILRSTPGILNDDPSVTPCDPTRISIDQQWSSQTVASSILNYNRSRSPSVSSDFSTSTRISHRCASTSSKALSTAGTSASNTSSASHHRSCHRSTSYSSSKTDNAGRNYAASSSFSNCLASHSFSRNAGRTSAISPSLSHRSTSNSSSRSCNAVRNCATRSSLSHRSTSHSSSRSYNAGRTSATSRSSPQQSTSNPSPRSSGRGCASLHHRSTSHSSSRSYNAGRTCGASSSSHCCSTSRSASTARGTSRTLPPSTETLVSHRSSTSCFSSRGSNVNSSLISTIRTTANSSFQRPNPVHHRHHRSSQSSSRHAGGDRSFRSGSELNSTSDRSYHTIGESSNSGALSRRNLTGTLAQSVQAAAAIQRSIERNIMSLRDGQEDVVSVLKDCLKELRRRN